MPLTEDEFKNFIKIVENPDGPGTDGLFRIYTDRISGLPHIGWGHLIDPRAISGELMQKFVNGLTVEEAQMLFDQDFQDHERSAKRLTDQFTTNLRSQGIQSRLWDQLTRNDQFKLIDFAYNLGDFTVSHPLFTQAVVTGDIASQLKQFRRFGTHKDTGVTEELLPRGNVFLNSFFSPQQIIFGGGEKLFQPRGTP